jgi:hypothetical protein
MPVTMPARKKSRAIRARDASNCHASNEITTGMAFWIENNATTTIAMITRMTAAMVASCGGVRGLF